MARYNSIATDSSVRASAWRPKRAGGDAGGAVAGEAGDAVNARGLDGFGQRHGRQDSGESTGQYGCACLCRHQQQMIADQNSAA
jgi:hypothetical protein